MCNCGCVLFKTNFDVDLKLLHIVCLCLSSFSIHQQQQKNPPSYILEVRYESKNTYMFHIPQKKGRKKKKKVVKKQVIDTKRNSAQPFAQCKSQNWKKPLQSVHMAWLFLARKLEEKGHQKKRKKRKSC